MILPVKTNSDRPYFIYFGDKLAYFVVYDRIGRASVLPCGGNGVRLAAPAAAFNQLKLYINGKEQAKRLRLRHHWYQNR